MTSQSVCEGCGRPVDPGTTLCASCAKAPPEHPARDDAPTIARPIPTLSLPGLTFRALIGEGGMGSVHLAEEVALGRRVAVKMIAERYAADEGVKSRFLREARAMATIEHPHVVRIYSYGEAAGTAYLTMEYVDGEDLATRLRRAGRLGVDETIRLALQIVEGLEAGWEHRIVHRDIKPSNILIDRRGNARVADFGLAKPIETGGDPSLTQSGYLLGTPQYISPEQAQGKSVDFRSDLYSLGVMLHHLLTGKHPFEASTPVAMVAKHLSEPLPPLERERPEVPIELARLIDWMARKDPGERPSSYAEVRERLAAMIASTPPTPVPTVKVPVASWSRGEQLKLAAALLVLAALAVIYAFQFGRGDAPPKDDAAGSEPADPRFSLAVAPFYGPDEDSAKEGRVMAALVERAVEKRLGAENVRIFGIDITEKPVRDHDAARALGAKLAADAVIWGEALSYRDETEITPQVTILTGKKKAEESEPGERGPMGAADPLSQLEEAPVQPVTLESEAPNQIAMRKMSAAGLGDVALFLAGVHALNKLEKPEKALELFRQAPPSKENLRYQVQALVAAGRKDEAIPLLEELSRDHADVSTSAQLGDLYAAGGRLKDAAAAYRAAAESGEPWATTRGFWHADRLYLKEMYSGPGGPKSSEKESGYLVEVDPGTNRVRARYRMPGYVNRFEPWKGGIAVPYTYRTGEGAATLHFANGSFEEPRPFGNLALRMAGIKSGRALAVNFLSEIERRREVGEIGLQQFRVTRIDDRSAPATFPDLERALRSAADRDPTQPWHPFLLGHALAGQGRRNEADAVWRAMLRGSYTETPYYEWAAMSSIAEKQGNTRLADATFEKARAARVAVGQPAYFAFFLERLINAPFVRAAASLPDMERRFLLLERGRQLVGREMEADIFAAAAWAKYWEERGDRQRARREREALLLMKEDPFNLQRLNALTDYAITVFLATVVTGLALLLILLPTAFRRAMAESAPRDAGSLLRRVPRIWVVVGTALLLGAVLLDVSWRVATMRPPLQLLGPLCAISLLAWLSWRFGVSPVALAARITVRERIALAAVLAGLLISAIGLLPIYRIGALASLPIGTSDSLGSIGTSDAFEKRYRVSPDPDMAFLVAVSHHSGGRADSARSFYQKASVAIDVKPWVDALDRGDDPPRLAYEQIANGLLGRSGSLESSWSVVEQAVDSIGPFIYLAALFAFLTLASLLVRPRAVASDADARPAGFVSRVLMLLVPGAYDLRRGNAIRGAATLFLALVWIVPAMTLLKSPVPAPGLLTSLWLPDVVASTPLPFTSDQDPIEFGWSAFLLVYPWARLFWSAIALSAVAALALHLTRIPRILRLARPAPLPLPAPTAG